MYRSYCILGARPSRCWEDEPTSPGTPSRPRSLSSQRPSNLTRSAAVDPPCVDTGDAQGTMTTLVKKSVLIVDDDGGSWWRRPWRGRLTSWQVAAYVGRQMLYSMYIRFVGKKWWGWGFHKIASTNCGRVGGLLCKFRLYRWMIDQRPILVHLCTDPFAHDTFAKTLRVDLVTRDHGGMEGIEEKLFHFPLNSPMIPL